VAKPICFMVMPFGVKPVEPRVDGVPDKVDFDALWNRALVPAIAELGYDPVRADQDTGAAIILEMLERLYFSDLVLADMTIPNGNVYYEIGIRHASRRTGCVLISADWARPLFDTNQMRRVVYPLPEGGVTEATAATIRAALKQGVPGLAQGASPMFEHLPGFPNEQKIDPNRASSIRKQLDAMSVFQSQVRAARLTRDSGTRRELAVALCSEYPATAPTSQAVALELVTLLRDCVGWAEMITYVDALPDAIRQLDFVQEQRCLAQSKAGDHTLAIGALEELVRRTGDSSERQGLIGGRYKKLADMAKKSGNELEYRDNLDRAIEHYERGMRLDLNDFFPSCNLPRLYKARGDEGDEHRAAVTAQIAMLACERDTRNEWGNPTRLGLAFDAADVDAAKRYAREVRRDGPAAWKLDTTITDLERSVAQAQDATKRQALEAILGELKSMIGSP